MTFNDFQGLWTPTVKCFKRLGIDIKQIVALQRSETDSLNKKELSFLATLMKSGLYIEHEQFTLRFAHPKTGKLRTVRKGTFTHLDKDTKNRMVLFFVDNEGDKGKLIYKKNKLVDPESPLEFKRFSSTENDL